MTVPYNSEQLVAIDSMVDHAENGQGDIIVLKAPAGAGKTTCVQEVVRRLPDAKVVLCAPTNKATRVLRESFRGSGLVTPDNCTIYSLLGLALMANGEVKNIAKVGDTADLSYYDLLGIDEAGMLNTYVTEKLFEALDINPKLSIIMMGDPYQLPPVKEPNSPVWELPNVIQLTRVMRAENQILTLATHIRELVANKGGTLKLRDDHDANGGVHFVKEGLTKHLLADAEAFRLGTSKAIAWRNVTVDGMNKIIRQALLDNWHEQPWQPTERITLLERAMSFDNELLAHTDDEATIVDVQTRAHPLYPRFLCYRVSVENDDGLSYSVWVLHETAMKMFVAEKERLAKEAYADHRRWKDFWSFDECFHKIRHAYATTAHRAQGSTYMKAYVDRRDILVNKNYEEALRCLYVGASRPKLELYIS